MTQNEKLLKILDLIRDLYIELYDHEFINDIYRNDHMQIMHKIKSDIQKEIKENNNE